MVDEVYYSALHWAKKAEASAKQAADLSQTSGKVVQIGFDGTLSNGVLVFKHAPGGTEIPYELVDDVEYEVDLNYANTGSLADTVKIQVKNGSDTINFVSAIHRSSTTPATVGDMKAVMRFDSSTGYRWLFKAAYKITPAGAKVMLLYPVVYNDEAVKALQTADAQNVKLTGDQTINHTKTFTSAITRSHEFTGGSAKTLTDVDTNGKGSIAIIPYYTGNKIYHRTYAENTTAGKHAYLDVTVDDSGVAGLHFGGSSSTFNVSFANAAQVIVPTPTTGDSSTKAATTAWVNTRLGGTGITSTEISYLDGVSSNIQTQLNEKANTSASNFNATGKSTILGWGIPNYSAGIDISSSVSAGYTVPKKGVVMVYTIPATNACQVTVNDVVVLTKEGTGGSYPVAVTLPVDVNDVVKVSYVSGGSIKFFPFKGA